jgi:xanthine permease XanP
VVFGVCLAASFVPMLIGPFIHRAQRVITPLVTGIVVTLIGLTLVSVGMTSVGGGFEARHDGSFGSAYNLGLALAVIVSIVSLNNSRREWLRMVSIAAGLGAGYAIAILAGQVSLAGLSDLPRFTLPAPFRYGLGFRATALIPFAFLYLITAVESIGDITATSLLVAEPITGAAYFRRLRGGVMADGVNSMLAAIFNSFPSTTFAQNNGVIQLTGVGSRRIGTLVGGLLIVMGMFPMVGGVIQAMPASVLGGATILMFGTVAVAGIRILSGIATGGLCALGLNALLPGKRA